MRLCVTVLFIAALLGAIGVVSTPAHAQAWTKIDCGSAHLLPPLGIQADCNQGPEDMGGTQSCHYFQYSLTVPANATEPRFYVRLRQSQNPRCGLSLFPNPANTIQHAAKFVEDEGSNWSGVQALDADTSIMFFDAKNQKREGKCFGFAKGGPSIGATGRAYQLFGYFCKPPGQALDASVAAAMVKGLDVKS